MGTVMPIYKGYYDPRDDQSKIIFGDGAVESLPAEVNKIGQRAMLITSETMQTKTNLVQRVCDLLGSNLAGIFSESALHTPRASILRAAAMARSLEPDLLISFGAGSHTDTAKALRLVLWQDIRDDAGFDRAFQSYRNNWRDGERNLLDRPLVPQIGIPTTLISAEHTQGVGITNEKTHGKQVFSHPDLRSQVIILDPQLSLATPPSLWFSTGIKALEHAIAKLAALERDPVIDAIAEQAVSLLGRGLRQCWNNPDDLSARNHLLIGSWLCMFGSWESLVKRMGLSHALGRQIGGVSGAPHGMISAVMLPFCMAFNAPVSAFGVERTARAMGVETSGMTPDRAAGVAADAVRALVSELKLPARLRDIGVKEASLPVIADRVMNDMSTATNPRPVRGSDEVLALLKQAW